MNHKLLITDASDAGITANSASIFCIVFYKRYLPIDGQLHSENEIIYVDFIRSLHLVRVQKKY